MTNPTTARGIISRALYEAGLSRDEFKVNTVRYYNNKPRGIVVMTSITGDKKIAEGDTAQTIQDKTKEMGAEFTVTISWTRSGQPLAYIHHSYIHTEYRKAESQKGILS